jgi:hypothetical protein
LNYPTSSARSINRLTTSPRVTRHFAAIAASLAAVACDSATEICARSPNDAIRFSRMRGLGLRPGLLVPGLLRVPIGLPRLDLSDSESDILVVWPA